MPKMAPKLPKKYNPSRVVNPTAPNHLVPLRPNQELDIVLDKSTRKKLVKISVDSAFFHDEWDATSNKDGGCTIRLRPKYDLSGWAAVSRVFLGEVIIEYKFDHSKNKNKQECSLCLIMDTVQSQFPTDEWPVFGRTLTVVNPRQSYVKVAPENVLEVILFSPKVTEKDALDCEITSGEGRIRYNVLAHTVRDSTSPQFANKRDAIRGHISKQFGTPGLEHHYFLSLGTESLDYIRSLAKGVHLGGAITFKSKKFLSFSLHVLLQVTHKQEKVKKQHHSNYNNAAYKVPAVISHPKKKDWDRHYSSDDSYEAAWESSWVNSGKRKTFETSSTSYGTGYYDVDLKPIESQSICDGCSIVWSKKNVLIYHE